MEHEERLNRMLESGVISKEQYSSLLESLDNKPAPEEASQKKKGMALLPLIGMGIIVIAVLFIVFGGLGDTASIDSVENIKDTFNQGKVGAMDSTTNKISAILFVGIFLLLPLIGFSWMHNGLVKEEEVIHTAWSQVESNYQRRADLIPNLVETVSKFLKHEKSTLENVTAKRNDGLDEDIAALIAAQKESAELLQKAGGKAPEDSTYISMLGASQKRVGQMMHTIMATAEAYPTLRASEPMQQLQAQLEGTENRINVARIRFNEAVGTFNASIRRMPTSMVASMGHFNRKAYFKSDEGADTVKKLNFD